MPYKGRNDMLGELWFSGVIPDRLEWFCHVDDDMYVNVEQLSGVLQQYDPAHPYYIGAWHRLSTVSDSANV